MGSVVDPVISPMAWSMSFSSVRQAQPVPH
jgi:hypothetical protein